VYKKREKEKKMKTPFLKLIILSLIVNIFDNARARDLLIFPDQSRENKEKDGNIGPIVAGLLLGLYEKKTPMIVHGHLLSSYAQATGKPENVQIAEAVKKVIEWGKPQKLIITGEEEEAEEKTETQLTHELANAERRLSEAAAKIIAEERKKIAAKAPIKTPESKEVGAPVVPGKKPLEVPGKPSLAFGDTPEDRAAVDFKACMVGLTIEDWYIYTDKNYDLVLLVPKAYIAKKVPVAITDPDKQVEYCGFKVRGETSRLQRVTGISQDKLADFLNTRDVVRGTDAHDDTSTALAEAIQAMFVVGEPAEVEPWQTYINGHGGPVSRSVEREKPEETEISPITSWVAGMSFRNAATLLSFFSSGKVHFRFAALFSCFLGGYQQKFLESWLNTIKTNFPVVAVGAGNNVVRKGILEGSTFGYQEIEGKQIPILKFKHSFADFFHGLDLYFGDNDQREKFVVEKKKLEKKRSGQLDKSNRRSTYEDIILGIKTKKQVVQYDPLSLIFSHILYGDTIFANNQPFIYFPHLGVFSALNVDKKIKIVNKTIAKAHALEGADIDCSNKKAAIITEQIVQARLILGADTLVESELKPWTLNVDVRKDTKKTITYAASMKARRDYGYVHLFNDVAFQGSFNEYIFNLVKCNPSFYTVFLTKQLTYHHSIDVGDATFDSSSYRLEDVIVLITGKEYLSTSEGMPARIQISAVVCNTRNAIRVPIYATWEIKNLETLSSIDSQRDTEFKFKTRSDLEPIKALSVNLLRDQDHKDLLKVLADKDPRITKLPEEQLFDKLATIIEQQAKTSTSVAQEQIGALGRFAQQHVLGQRKKQLAAEQEIFDAIKKQLAQAKKITNTEEQQTAYQKVIGELRQFYIKKWGHEQREMTYFAFKSFIEKLIELDAVDVPYGPEGQTALFEAISNSHMHGDSFAFVEKLIAAGADVNKQDARQRTALFLAVTQVAPNLVHAFELNRLLSMLLKNGADYNIPGEFRDKYGHKSLQTPLQAMLITEKQEYEMYAEEGVDKSYHYRNIQETIRILNDLIKKTTLVVKEKIGALSTLGRFARKHIVNQRKKQIAAEQEMFDDIKKQLAEAKKITDTEEQQTAYQKVIGGLRQFYIKKWGHEQREMTYFAFKSFIEKLIELDAVDVPYDREGQTALLEAMRKSHSYGDNFDFAKKLIVAGANVNKQDSAQETALFLAVNQLEPDLVSMLLKSGADFTIPSEFPDKFGKRSLQTPLQAMLIIEKQEQEMYVEEGVDKSYAYPKIQKIIRILNDWINKTPEERATEKNTYAKELAEERTRLKEEIAETRRSREENVLKYGSR